MGAGVVISNFNVIEKISKFVGIGTSNIAEWCAFLIALDYAVNYLKNDKSKHFKFYSDSQLIVNQFKGQWEIKEKHFIPLYEKAIKLRDTLGDYFESLEWIPREDNKEADILSKEAFNSIQVCLNFQSK
jgi:ribonuclease HI